VGGAHLASQSVLEGLVLVDGLDGVGLDALARAEGLEHGYAPPDRGGDGHVGREGLDLARGRLQAHKPTDDTEEHQVV
jgi:hypothetical protein